MKNKKLLRIVLIVLAVLVVFLIVGSKAGWIGSQEGTRVSTEEVTPRNIVEIVTASGKVQPVTEVKISPDVSGEIIELPIREGDFVKRGDLLAKINPDLYLSALDRVAASVNTSRANLANARARSSQAEAQFINATSSYNRNQQLYDQGAISDSEFEAARAQYLVAQAEVEAARQSVVGAEYQVKSAEASLKEARESLAKTSIFAPMDGTVSRLDAEIGERVVGTSQFAGTEILRIANLNQMEVLVEVNENDIIRVHEGDTASIEIDAFLGKKFQGVVTAISNSAQVEGLTVDQVTNFEVRIEILTESYQDLVSEDQPHLSPFRPGMSATVDIRTQRVHDALSVPIQAVTTRQEETPRGDSIQAPPETPQSPQEYVFLLKDGKAVLQPVTTGIQDSQYIEIKSGLEEKQEVITGPYRAISRELKDGDAVIKTERQELFGEN
ncbi:MAG: efflux RND transporter periplasmic adaptor subunit [Bacteroides sp.]|jgi:HlyD family secretion protein|nr:efflux RND transporter periplasmic adaptor subunit [Bacteroides sp.]